MAKQLREIYEKKLIKLMIIKEWNEFSWKFSKINK
jgi:hypothetical protein